MEEKKSYYAIVPANVRYDKKLTSNAKLMYGEITALCNEKGFCWAGDTYFSSLYEVSNRSIQRWLSSLEDGGYLERRVEYADDGKTVVRRTMHILPGGVPTELSVGVPTEMSGGGDNFVGRGGDKNVVVNNTLSNTTSNTTIYINPKVSNFLDLQSGNVTGVAYQIKKKGEKYYEENQLEYDRLIKDALATGTPEDVILAILDWIPNDDFWCKQIGSITKLRKKNREKIPYWVYILGVMGGKKKKSYTI